MSAPVTYGIGDVVRCGDSTAIGEAIARLVLDDLIAARERWSLFAAKSSASAVVWRLPMSSAGRRDSADGNGGGIAIDQRSVKPLMFDIATNPMLHAGEQLHYGLD